jgi:hypothetical protein
MRARKKTKASRRPEYEGSPWATPTAIKEELAAKRGYLTSLRHQQRAIDKGLYLKRAAYCQARIDEFVTARDKALATHKALSEQPEMLQKDIIKARLDIMLLKWILSSPELRKLLKEKTIRLASLYKLAKSFASSEEESKEACEKLAKGEL